uniref:Caspase recruitment domain family, member 14 n=1 Tax=Amphilophus citrinellus TaxID=61819 RepID=A0A3Q0T4Z6_AMPCI
MAGVCVPEGLDPKEMGEEELWELINDSRHRISLGVRPCILIPYLRQARVLSEMDEDEILSCHNLTNRCMRTHMLDLLRTQGKNGAMALLESLMIHYPALYTQVTGRKPSTEPSRFSLIKYSELTEYLVRAVTGMQKELQELKDEKCDLYIRYTAAIEEKSVYQLQTELQNAQTEKEFQRRHSLRSVCPETPELHEEVRSLRCQLAKAEKLDPDILAQDLAEAIDSQVELAEQLRSYREENEQLLRDKQGLLDQKECLSLQVQQLTLDCKMHQQKSTVIQNQMKELKAERDQAYQSRDEAQAMIARILAEKDTLRCQLVELQEKLSRTSPPPFLMRSRPRAIRISGRVISISFQGEALLTQLTVVGGNKTGVFVHEVTEGSAAHTVGISPGAQIVELQVKYEKNQKALRMVLEDSTLEEAMWALGQVTGVCHLSLRPRQDYEALLQQLQSCETSSGDSFYVRANTSLPAGPGGTLTVVCNDILHVTNTRPAGTDDSWHASHVHPCQLLDLQSGTVPNYYAQRLLIRAIEDMSFQAKKFEKGRVIAQNTQKTVRIVGTGRQGRNPLWVSVEEEEDDATSAPKSCVTLMPYTLVTPHYPPVCRPVLLLPSVLGRILDKKLASWQGFQLCEPVLTSSEHAARLQKSEILEEVEQGGNSCYTLQSVEKVMKKLQGIHCVLPLGLDCVRRLQRSEIFPIIIFLLACSSSEEPLLDKLPCLYHSVDPDSWCDQASLLNSLRTIIWEEQKKIVWVEPDLW